MVLVSYRDNEVTEFHPFTQAINSIKNNNLDANYLIIQEIHLQPLDAKHVASLVSDTLQLESLEVAELAELIYEKTKGNAFSLNKFLESLYTQKLLLFDYQSNKWTWDIRKIKAQNLSENIVDLLLMRIRKLPEEALQVIKAASVFGIEFSLFQLSMITEKSSTTVHQFLWPLIQEGSLIPVGNDYRYIPEFYGETNRDVKFRFAHARIQQAVYALLEKKEESRFHFEVGQIYLKRLTHEQIQENLVKERTRELEEKKQKSDSLLLNILPKEIAFELILKGKASARLYDHVSVMFIDIKDFTTISQAMTPDNLVKNLHEFFTKFDDIMDEFGLEKIKTIGDAYMAAGGIPTPSSDHAVRMVNAGLKILEFVESYNKERLTIEKAPFAIRIGIHSGPVVADVVGSRKFAYDIWGDTVNIASRMESNSEPGKINISEDHYQVIADQFECEHRGEIPVKNKGVMNMYFVNHPKIKKLNLFTL